MAPLNPRPRVEPLDDAHVTVRFTVRACNACEREFVEGDEFQAHVDPDAGTTIAVHVPECPT